MYLVKEELMQDIIGMFVACQNTMIAAMNGYHDRESLDWIAACVQNFRHEVMKKAVYDPNVISKKLQSISQEDAA